MLYPIRDVADSLLFKQWRIPLSVKILTYRLLAFWGCTDNASAYFEIHAHSQATVFAIWLHRNLPGGLGEEERSRVLIILKNKAAVLELNNTEPGLLQQIGIFSHR